MASYGINLDLRLNGQSAVDRAVRGAKSLEAIVKRLNDKPLNLANIGGAARTAGGRLGEARKEVKAFAEALNKGEKQFASTEAGLREYVAAFRQLAANTEAGTSTFDTFVGALAKAEQKLDEIALATENARRKALGLLSVEEEAAEKARQEAQRKAKDKEAKARRDNERAAQREARELRRLNQIKEREAKIEERRRKEQRRRKFTDIATGVGFPLLFGGGPGSAIGGLVGGALGGLGGSVLGSALGQQFDKVGQAALNTAKAFDKLGATASDLIAPLGRGAGGGFGAQAEFLIGQGRSSQVADILRARFDEVYGEGATAKFDELARVGKELEGTFQEIGIALQTLMMGPLKEFLKALQAFTPAAFDEQARVTEQRQRFKRLSQLDDIEANKGELTLTQRLEREDLLAQVELATRKNKIELDGGNARLRLEALITAERKDAEKVAKLTVELEQVALTARRDTLATMRGNLQVTTAQLDLNRIQAQLDLERKKTNQDILTIARLQREELDAQTALDVAKAARDNARIQAERQIIKEQIAGAGTRIQLINDASNLQLQFLQNEEGRFNLVAEEFQMMRHNLDVNKGLLELQRKSALMGVTEAERQSAINREYDLRGDLLERQAELQAQALIQAKAAHDVARMQVAQTREMETLTARMNAQQQIAATSPFANEGFLTDPFFGESSKLEAEQALNYANTLEQLNKQLDQVTARRLAAANASPQLRQSLEDEQAALRNQIANYKEYQPAINEAALAQARFNDALQIAVPVTDSLFDSLMAVAEGTKTAQQAFADFLRMIADMLMKAAAQMIATYIAIGVARMFAGVPSGSEASGTDKHIADVSSAMKQYNFDFGGGMASGGRVSSGTSYLVGERGPELFTPGASGTITPNHAMGGMASNIVVNVDATGSSVEGNAEDSKRLGESIGIAIRQELIKQKRPGGLLA